MEEILERKVMESYVSGMNPGRVEDKSNPVKVYAQQFLEKAVYVGAEGRPELMATPTACSGRLDDS